MKIQGLFMFAALTFSAFGQELRVLTLNAWQFPVKAERSYLAPLAKEGVFAKDILARREMIRKRILESKPDVIAFQEVWGQADMANFSALMSEVGYACSYGVKAPAIYSWGIPPVLGLGAWSTYHGMRMGGAQCPGMMARLTHNAKRVGFIAGGGGGSLLTSFVLETADHMRKDMGNGLLICSKYPMENLEILRFSNNPLDRTAPEENLNVKGAIRVTLRVPGVGLVDVFNTHADARDYNLDKEAYETRHTQANARQVEAFYDWIKSRRSDPNRPLIVAGDLNVDPFEVEKGVPTDKPTRAYQTMVQQGPESLKLKNTQVEVLGEINPNDFTFSGENKYIRQKRNGKDLPDEHIDYVFFGGKGLQPKSWQVVYKDKEPISDHFGVFVEFTLMPQTP